MNFYLKVLIFTSLSILPFLPSFVTVINPPLILPQTRLTPDLLSLPQKAQEVPEFAPLMRELKAEKLDQKPLGKIIQTIALKFLGSSYKAGLLDQFPQETLWVSLKEFDCVLLVETVLAISQGIVQQNYSYSLFVKHLESLRYRGGQLNPLQGYCSRLHYFSDWINDNQNRGFVTNITAKLGGITLNKSFSFMTQHREKYPQLVSDEKTYQCILEREKYVQSLPFYYLPTSQIRKVYTQLQPGDIIAVVTDIQGLDVTHTGLIDKNSNGSVGLIHASPIGRVVISPDLSQYINRVDRAIGVIIVRVQSSVKN